MSLLTDYTIHIVRCV